MLSEFQPNYVCVDGDGTVPTESAKVWRYNNLLDLLV